MFLFSSAPPAPRRFVTETLTKTQTELEAAHEEKATGTYMSEAEIMDLVQVCRGLVA